MVEQEIPTTITYEQAQQIIDLLLNLTNGFYIVLLILSAFFVWKVIKIFYNLLNGVFLGGL